MGADVGKCVCAPDSRDVDYHSNMQKSGEKDRCSTDSDSCLTSDEGNVDGTSSTELESETESESEEASSSSSHRRNRHSKNKNKHKNKNKKKERHKRKPKRKPKTKKEKEKEKRRQKRKRQREKKKRQKRNERRRHRHDHHDRHRRYDDTSSSSSSSSDESTSSEAHTSNSEYATGSSSDSDYSHESSGSNDDNATMIFVKSPPEAPPFIPHNASSSSIRDNPRDYMLNKKRQKQHDRVKRKLKVAQQHAARRKMMEHQKQSYSYHHMNMNPESLHNPYEHELMPLHPLSRTSIPSLSHPTLPFRNESFHDSVSDHGGSSERHSVHSIHSAELPPTDGKHPRIHSMSHIDQATIELLTNPRNVQQIFNPKPKGFRVDIQAANQYQSQSQPQSPQSVHVEMNAAPLQPSSTFQPSLTPTSHHYYTYNHATQPPPNPQQEHKPSHSVEMESFPNVQVFTGHNITPRRHSNPLHHNVLFGQQPATCPADNRPPKDIPPPVAKRHSLPNTGALIFDLSQAGLGLNAMLDPLDSKGPKLTDQVSVPTPTPGEDTVTSPEVTSPPVPRQLEASHTNASETMASNISPKFTSTDYNAIPNEITISNLNTLFVNKPFKVHGKNPNAVPPSPPIEHVYKPLPSAGLNSNLSKISEGSQGTGSGNNDSSENALSAIKLDELQPAVEKNKPMVMVLSSPDDDEDTVAQQWMDLHKYNIPDTKVPNAPLMDNPFVSIQTEATEESTDLSSAEEAVMLWKGKVENAKPQSSIDEEEAEEDHDEHLKDSTYSTESHQSSDDNPTSDEPHKESTYHSTTRHVKRHSKLFRKQSFRKWKPTEIKNEANDMQKHYDYMKQVEQGKELNAMKQLMNDMQEKEKSSGHSNWIEQ